MSFDMDQSAPLSPEEEEEEKLNPPPAGNKRGEEPPPWLYDRISDASNNAGQVFTIYLGFLAYCALTVISTTDRQIILNERAHLPIINLEVPLNGFFWLAPIILLLSFGYLQLSLHRLNALTFYLGAKYSGVDSRRVYPWIMNIGKNPEPDIIGRLQVFTANFILWIPLPVILSLNALWYIKKHEPILSYS